MAREDFVKDQASLITTLVVERDLGSVVAPGRKLGVEVKLYLRGRMFLDFHWCEGMLDALDDGA